MSGSASIVCVLPLTLSVNFWPMNGSSRGAAAICGQCLDWGRRVRVVRGCGRRIVGRQIKPIAPALERGKAHGLMGTAPACGGVVLLRQTRRLCRSAVEPRVTKPVDRQGATHGL